MTITLEQATELRDAAQESNETGAVEVAAVLDQLITHLHPKTIQLISIDETLLALKDDGTIWSSVGGNGINWRELPLPK